MPKATPEDVFYSPHLTNLSIAYIQDQLRFIATKFAPIVPTATQAAKYATFSKADFMRDEAQRREPGKESAGISFGESKDSYSCELYAVHYDITRDMRVARRSISEGEDQIRQLAMRLVTNKLLLKMEKAFATNLFATGKWTDEKAGQAAADATHVAFWNDKTNGTPVDDILAAATRISLATGYRPNTLVLQRQVFDVVRRHPQVVDQFKYTSSASITSEMLANLLELERVLIAEAVVNNAVETVTNTPTMAFVHGKHALLAYVNPDSAPQKEMPSAAYTFGWTDMVEGAPAAGIAISELPRDPKTQVDRIEGESAWDMKLTGADLGAFFKDVIQ